MTQIFPVDGIHRQDHVFAARPRKLGPPKTSLFQSDVDVAGDEIQLRVYDLDGNTPRTPIYGGTSSILIDAGAPDSAMYTAAQLPWPGDGDDIGYTFIHRIAFDATNAAGVNWTGGHKYRVWYEFTTIAEGFIQLVFDVAVKSVKP